MASINFNLRLDSDLRNRSFAVFESYGLSASQAIKLFLNQVAETSTIPLSFEYQKVPNAATVAAIEDARAGRLSHAKDLDDLFRQLEAD